MRIVILVFALSLVAATPAYAADANSITVIKEDGTKIVVPLDSPEPAASGTKPAPVVRPVAKPAPAKEDIIQPKPYVDEIVAPQKQPASENPPEKDEASKAATEETVKKEPVKKAAPAAESKENPKKSEKKAKAEKSKSKKAQAKSDPKKETEKTVTAAPGPTDIKRAPNGAPVSEEEAIAIALPHAPPSKGYDLTYNIYQGARVYVITFKTEEGPYDVIVNAGTGAVMLSAPVNAAPMQPKPGHLPPDWEPLMPQRVGKPETE